MRHIINSHPLLRFRETPGRGGKENIGAGGWGCAVNFCLWLDMNTALMKPQKPWLPAQGQTGLAQTGRGSQSPLLIGGLLEINSCWGRIILFWGCGYWQISHFLMFGPKLKHIWAELIRLSINWVIKRTFFKEYLLGKKWAELEREHKGQIWSYSYICEILKNQEN